MVVGHLRRVEHLLRLLEWLAAQRAHQFGVRRLAGEARLEQSVHRLRALRIDVVRQVAGVHTRIGGDFLFVETLYEVERQFGREAELLVAVHLQRRQVVELRRSLCALLLLDACHRKRVPLNQLERLLALFLRVEAPLRGSERRVAIDGGQHPVGLGLEVVNLLLAVHDEGQRRRLHATYRQHLAVLPVLQRVETRGVHAQQPVADGARESGQVERLIFRLVLQLGKALADGLVGHRRYPQPLDWAPGACLLHHPALNEFSFLPGIAAVHDAVGGLHQAFDDGKLLLDAVVVNELDAESRRQHRQRAQRPTFPLVGVVVGFLQRAQVTERPRHLIAVALHIVLAVAGCPYDAGNVATDAWFLCYANNHAAKVQQKTDKKQLFSLFSFAAVPLSSFLHQLATERVLKASAHGTRPFQTMY